MDEPEAADIRDQRPGREKKPIEWVVARWLLLAGWVLGAGLGLARVRGGFLTSYLADLTFPAWYYLTLRGLGGPSWAASYLPRWILASPAHTAGAIFAVGVVAEWKTLYWPHGPIAGTFDAWDIVAYGVGLALCWAGEVWQANRA